MNIKIFHIIALYNTHNNILHKYYCIMELSDIPNTIKQTENHNKVNRVEQFTTIQQESLELFIRKNADYGDAFSKFGFLGVIVRLQDKINRLITINKNSIIMVENETVRDTILDLYNYSALALMLLDEPENEKKKEE